MPSRRAAFAAEYPSGPSVATCTTSGRLAAHTRLSSLPAGKVFWLQPVVVNKNKETRWGSAISYLPPPPLEPSAPSPSIS